MYFFYIKSQGKIKRYQNRINIFLCFVTSKQYQIGLWNTFLAQNNTYKNIHLTVSFAIGNRIFTTE